MNEMNEMNEINEKQTFLNICMDIEGLCADLYHYYSKIYEDYPEASSLWKKAALEEENHQRQFELASRLWEETDFEVMHESMKRAHSIQFKLVELIKNIKSIRPDLLTAVSKAVEMEEILADLHVQTSLKFKEESMQKLFHALSEADHDHVADLQRFRSILYLPLSEMKG